MQLRSNSTKMIVYTILHNDIEKVGVIEQWIKQSGFSSVQVRPYAGDALPELTGDEIVVIMGGAQSALALDEYPYLADEMSFIQQAHALGCPLFGVCLGAQLIAAALGGRVVRAEHKEMGEFPIALTPEAKNHPWFAGWPENPPVFHWHFDQIEPPKEAVVLASSRACPVQAFAIGSSVIGVQFHLELSRERAAHLVREFGEDLEPTGPYTKCKKRVLEADFAAMNRLLLRLLDRWTLTLLSIKRERLTSL